MVEWPKVRERPGASRTAVPFHLDSRFYTFIASRPAKAGPFTVVETLKFWHRFVTVLLLVLLVSPASVDCMFCETHGDAEGVPCQRNTHAKRNVYILCGILNESEV